MIDLSGKIALVTGAASGIGRASACSLASGGATVVVADRHRGGGEETVGLIERAGGEALFVSVDVSDSTDVASLLAGVVQRFGRLDFAHNNAGVESAPGLVGDAFEADWDRCDSINLKGVWLCMRAELAQMHRQGYGAIVNTSSVGGLTGVPGGAAYSAAKHGVVGLTRSAALDYAKFNIRINAICPGLTKTAMTERLLVTQPDTMKTLLPPMGRFAEADEIAGVVAFLFSDLASFMTGQCIAIDGGATAR